MGERKAVIELRWTEIAVQIAKGYLLKVYIYIRAEPIVEAKGTYRNDGRTTLQRKQMIAIAKDDIG